MRKIVDIDSCKYCKYNDLSSAAFGPYCRLMKRHRDRLKTGIPEWCQLPDANAIQPGAPMKSIDDLVEELDEALDEAADYLSRDEPAMAAIARARAWRISAEIQEREEEKRKWISITERLPERPGQYWCYDMDEAVGSGSCTPWVDWFNPKKDNGFITFAEDMDGNPCAIKDHAVTHWAEIIRPKSPAFGRK